MDFLGLLILSFIGESIWETLKMTWRNGKVNIDRVGALIVGLLLAFGSSLDIMAVVGVPIIVPYLGTVLTGILISRGANFVHDIMSSISNLKQYTDISK
jgi:hypothetical protein